MFLIQNIIDSDLKTRPLAMWKELIAVLVGLAVFEKPAYTRQFWCKDSVPGIRRHLLSCLMLLCESHTVVSCTRRLF